jgi:outer membrane protein OmpA-like peptidoglycan-associated protein
MSYLVKKSFPKAILIILIATLVGCSSLNNAQRGGVIGVGAGAAAGAVAGALLGDTAKGAIIGAVVGGAAGAIIGSQMDRQARQLEQELEGANIERVGEAIAIKFDSGLLFGFDSAELSDDARSNLQILANSLKTYDNTDVLIIGHTDGIGSATYNMGLSERRALSAKRQLQSLGVPADRILTEGRGLTEPIADNATDEGRLLNRRVEVLILASEEFKLEAAGN